MMQRQDDFVCEEALTEKLLGITSESALLKLRCRHDLRFCNRFFYDMEVADNADRILR